MIRSGNILALCLLLLLSSFTFSVGAQSLSSLPKASDVVTGTLPNGISYYLVTNRDSKGVADFALVQKGAVNEDAAKEALTDLPHFQSGRPYQYLAKLGVGYEKYGLFHVEDGSIAYHFQDVPVDRQAVRDTVLLLLFDISETCPYEQAMIISGDIDRASIQERMNVFSMMVTSREKADEQKEVENHPDDGPGVRCEQTGPREEAVLTVSYSAPRTPREVMGTVQPLVSDMFARELGEILRLRVNRVFREKRIPLAGTGWDYRSSADGPYDEKYSLTVTVPASEVVTALETVASILSEMDANGASLPEFKDVRGRVLSSLTLSHRLSNSEWISKCRSSFLFGSDLASPEMIGEFFSTRDVPVDRERELFNSFVSALLDRTRSLQIRCAAPGRPMSEGMIMESFQAGWDARKDGPVREYASSAGDSLSLVSSKKMKAKLKRAVPEPVTGGELWTFSNGMKVIFKQSSSVKGHFSYGLLLNGGYMDVPDLARGEGGFVADMLGVCNVAGLSGFSFTDMLESNNISFKPSASLTDLRITGTAPSSELGLLMRSLVSLANSRTLNKDAYDYYRSSERLRISLGNKGQAGIDAAVDSILCPDYIYLESRSADAMSDDLPERAEKYFSRQFSKCDDGIIVLVGDLDPYVVKKVLPGYMGGFVVGGIPSVRPQIRYTPRSGWSTYTVDASESELSGRDLSVNVAESVALPFSLERYFTSMTAVMELEKQLAASLSETGMYSEVSSEYDLFPSEQLTVRISCRPAEETGLPRNVIQADPLRTLGAVRSALTELSSGEGSSAISGEALSKASVSASKAFLLSQYEQNLQKPDFLVDMALIRYSVGKDCVSGYKDKINSVTPESVKEVLSSLDGGGKVELVIY